ncbi:hypothetical protein ABH992_004329 [Bradyrhizobium yuanmingense]|uniref:Uncharacterized protein n=1 Tax=Bradyrhizobium yuanmingense TaxID=108015 RepID=A0ABV4GJ10_9BRAD
MSTFIRLTKEKPQVAVQHGVEPVQVAEVDRVVETELGPECRLHFGRHVRIGGQFGERIAGRERKHDEQHQRNRQQARNGDQEATQDILTHREESRLACAHASRYQS